MCEIFIVTNECFYIFCLYRNHIVVSYFIIVLKLACQLLTKNYRCSYYNNELPLPGLLEIFRPAVLTHMVQLRYILIHPQKCR